MVGFHSHRKTETGLYTFYRKIRFGGSFSSFSDITSQSYGECEEPSGATVFSFYTAQANSLTPTSLFMPINIQTQANNSALPFTLFVAVYILVSYIFSRRSALAYILISQVVGYLVVSFWGLIGLRQVNRTQ
jgi:hypothetical protein